MSNYLVPSFKRKEEEISKAIATLRRYELNIKLPSSITKQIEASTLFDGNDGLFKELIEDVEIYFEYGCGKSTEYVYRITSAKIFAVDTSLQWIKKMESLKSEGSPDRLNLNWVDVGHVQDWGYPTSFKMRHNFKKYAELFWLNKLAPGLVLIDGRFRISCFLTSIKYAPVGTKILFDDYTERSLYHVAEEFCDKLDTCGRQALFQVTLNSKQKVTDEIINTFTNVIA